MLVVLYAVIREKEKVYHVWDVFICFDFGSYFRVWSSYKKKQKTLNTFKNFLKPKPKNFYLWFLIPIESSYTTSCYVRQVRYNIRHLTFEIQKIHSNRRETQILKK